MGKRGHLENEPAPLVLKTRILPLDKSPILHPYNLTPTWLHPPLSARFPACSTSLPWLLAWQEGLFSLLLNKCWSSWQLINNQYMGEVWYKTLIYFNYTSLYAVLSLLSLLTSLVICVAAGKMIVAVVNIINDGIRKRVRKGSAPMKVS